MDLYKFFKDNKGESKLANHIYEVFKQEDNLDELKGWFDKAGGRLPEKLNKFFKDDPESKMRLLTMLVFIKWYTTRVKDIKIVNKRGEDVKKKAWREKEYRERDKYFALVEKHDPDKLEDIKRDYRKKPAKKPELDIMVQIYRLFEGKTDLKPGDAIHKQMADFFNLFNIKNEAGNKYNRHNVRHYLNRELSI